MSVGPCLAILTTFRILSQTLVHRRVIQAQSSHPPMKNDIEQTMLKMAFFVS